MSLIVNTNIASLATQRALGINIKETNASFEKLSTGYRINHAADDNANLSISEKMRSQIRGNQLALKNAQDGVNMLDTADGGLKCIGENLQKIRELTVQAANDTYGSVERKSISREVTQRLQDINTIASALKFNNINLLNGSGNNVKLQIGGNQATGSNVMTIANAFLTATATALGFNPASITAAAGGFYNSGGFARNLLSTIDSAINVVTTRRSMVGSYENKLKSAIQTLSIQELNLTSSESQIRDLNIATESSELTKKQVLQQATISMLTQANQTPSMALNLIR